MFVFVYCLRRRINQQVGHASWQQLHVQVAIRTSGRAMRSLMRCRLSQNAF
ncbi:hypothetical protein HMPREF9248_0799 [Fannyhessea vaginae PB189-T1-4]|uniref:Uncharacterized protein n=1 Tax=Fannyhessea vaginae PB189-T1-4 TaxID=866774 RepID=A0ABN0B1N0_9ACTN|nr:hypothetical protein HMPREF9248_0799 [Fannyhessea vaginae PB189-T1-4]